MRKIVIKYRCQHISCRKPSCYQGSLSLDKDRYDILTQDIECNLIRSPSGYCSLGTSQKFEILNLVEIPDTKTPDTKTPDTKTLDAKTPDAKTPPEEALKILRSKLSETESVKAKIEQQINSLQKTKEQADKNILELNQRIVDLTSKTEKRD